MKKIILLFVFILFILSCDKNDTENQVEQQDGTKWSVMSNPTDPMFAIAKTDASQVEFYGKRDAEGIPSNLNLITVKTQNDTIYYTLDDLGRPIIVQINKSYNIKFNWKNNDEADVIVNSPYGVLYVKDPISMAKVATGKNDSNVDSSPISQRIQSDNVTINVINCTRPITTYIGEVGIELRTIELDKQKTDYFRAEYDKGNGKYVASYPQTVTETLVASPDVCNKIVSIMSAACELGDAGQFAIVLACIAIDAALLTSGLPAPAIVAISASCAVAVRGYDFLCTIVDKSGLAPLLCEAKWEKRIYNKTISLQPIAFYNGKKISGESISTIGGSQPIDLKLDLGCDKANLIQNGDFSQGNTGFTTSYTYCSSSNCLFPLANNGYAIANDASSRHNSFVGKDHTDGNGLFMIVNGAKSNYIVWKQTVNITTNTIYDFECWVSTLFAQNISQVAVKINGVQLGDIFTAPSSVNQWIKLSRNWDSGSNTVANIEIFATIDIAGGNDFGLDDISFK